MRPPPSGRWRNGLTPAQAPRPGPRRPGGAAAAAAIRDDARASLLRCPPERNSAPRELSTQACLFAAPRESRRDVDERREMASGQPDSGTKDKNYDLITVTHLCLEHVFRLEQYAQDADKDGDEAVATLFRRMQEHSRRG